MQEPIIDTITARPQRVRYRPGSGAWLWLANRISAYALIVFLSVHLYLNYFAAASAGMLLTFEVIHQRYRLDPLLYTLNTFGLLVTALFHGLSSVRSLFYDYVTSPLLRRLASLVLLLVGAWAVIEGGLALLALLRGA